MCQRYVYIWSELDNLDRKIVNTIYVPSRKGGSLKTQTRERVVGVPWCVVLQDTVFSFSQCPRHRVGSFEKKKKGLSLL